MDFLLPFWNLHEMENIFKKKEIPFHVDFRKAIKNP